MVGELVCFCRGLLRFPQRERQRLPSLAINDERAVGVPWKSTTDERADLDLGVLDVALPFIQRLW